MKLAILGSFVAFGLAANAQDEVVANIVTSVSVSLSGYKQSGDTATPVRITNKDIFSSLNSNGYSFGRGARLFLVEDSGGAFTFQVRERVGTEVTTTDVTGAGALAIAVADGAPIVTVRSGAEYTILTFIFNNGADTTVTVSGFARIKKGRITGRGIGTLSNARLGAAVQVSGSGTVAGDPGVVRGVINAGKPKLESVE